MDFGFTEEQSMLRDSVRKLMERHRARPSTSAGSIASRPIRTSSTTPGSRPGCSRMPFPEEYGGLGGNVVDMAIIAEELSRTQRRSSRWRSAAACSAASTSCARAPRSRSAIGCRSCSSGEIRMSISMSEPDAGSDVGAMRTTARRDGNDYVINGQKLWATGAGAKNNVINVYVKTDPKAHYRQGMSLFLVDNDTPGSRCASSTCSAGAASAPTRSSSTTCACRPTGSSAARTRAGTASSPACRSSASMSAAGDCGARAAVVDMALALRQGAQAVRPPDRHLPGDRPHARRHADRGRGRARADVARGLDGRRPARTRCARSRWPSCSPRRPT